MKSFFSFLAVSFLLFCACSSESEQLKGFDYYDWSDKEVHLKVDRVLKMDTIIDYLMSINREGDYYVVEYPYDWALYKLDGDQLVFDRYLIKKGSGPYETSSSTRFSKLNDGRYFLSECIGSKKIFVSPTSDSDELSDITRWKSMSREDPSLPYFLESIQPINDEMVIGSTLGNSKSKFATYDLKTKQYAALDYIYPAVYDELSDAQKAFAMEGVLMKKPNENKYLFKPNIGLVMLLFECEGNKIGKAKYIFNQFAAFGKGEGDENARPRLMDRKAPYGMTVSVADDYIYLKGKLVTVEEVFGPNSSSDNAYADNVLSFDWNGKPHKKYILDEKINNFMVDDDDSVLYAIVEGEDGYEIRVYNIPD